MNKPRGWWIYVALVLGASVACGGPSTSHSDPPAVDPGAPPNVSVAEMPVDFGFADCGGAPPEAKVVKITNSGGGTVSWTAELESIGFEIVGASSGTFSGGGSVNVKVQANAVPASAAAGSVSLATLVIVIDKAKIFRVPLRVTAQGATLTVLPGEAVFGEVPINMQAPDLPLVITNTGNKEVSFSVDQPALTDFKVAWTGSPAAAKVAGGATVPGAVARFRPSRLNLQSTMAPIKVKGAVCGVSATVISMNGKGTGGVVGVSPGQLDFGKVNCGGKGTFQVLTILNSGNSPFNWTASLGLGGASSFEISPVSGTVLAGSQTNVFVTPKAIPQTSEITNNLYGDTLTVTTDAANDTPHPLPLYMGARGAILALTATPTDYGVKTIFGAATVKTATVSNTGNAAASVKLATGTSSYSVSPNVSTSVAAGGTLNANVTFSPASFGSNDDQLSMTTADVLCAPLPGSAALTGQGKGVATQVSVGFGSGKRNGGVPQVGSSCAVITGGHVACWGDNSFGQIGIGAASGVQQSVPVVIPNFADAVAVTTAGDFACARTSGGALYCWGNNADLQLGIAGGNKASPTLVASLTNVISVDVHQRHSCAVVATVAGGTSGKVMCWGSNHRGQLGNGTANGGNAPGLAPVQVTGITDAISVSVGSFGGCARRVGNTVSCWGRYNYRGNLGNATTTYNVAGTPVAVASLANATFLETGGGNRPAGGASCAISGGNVLCWGDNGRAKIVAAPNPVALSTPVTIPGVTAATAVTVGSQHMCAVVAGGAVKCWGRGQLGQLGNNATPDPSAAVDVTGLAGATQISAGGQSTCAVISGGSISCWGSNSHGQLGNPAAPGLTPSVVSGF